MRQPSNYAGLLNPRRGLSLQIALVGLFVIVQIAEVYVIFRHLDSGGGHQTAELLILLGTLSVALIALVLLSRIPIIKDIARIHAVAEHINDGVLLLEGNKVILANSLARAILGNEPQTRAEIRPEVFEILDQARLSHAPIPFDANLEGHSRHFFVSRLHIPNQSPDSQVFVFQDATFLRENEEAKVNFIGTLSHEIKTPITSLTMALGMLERTGYDAELVRIANVDVARLRTLLDDLLNVTRLKLIRGPKCFDKQEADLTNLVSHAVKAAASRASEKGIKLSTRIPPEKHIIATIDPTRLSWVISTLIGAAIRQTPEEENVEVELDLVEGNAVFVVRHERRFDSLGPAGHATVRDILEAHAGKFISIHDPSHKSIFKFLIHARVKDQKPARAQTKANKIRGTIGNEANIAG